MRRASARSSTGSRGSRCTSPVLVQLQEMLDPPEEEVVVFELAGVAVS